MLFKPYKFDKRTLWLATFQLIKVIYLLVIYTIINCWLISAALLRMECFSHVKPSCPTTSAQPYETDKTRDHIKIICPSLILFATLYAYWICPTSKCDFLHSSLVWSSSVRPWQLIACPNRSRISSGGSTLSSIRFIPDRTRTPTAMGLEIWKVCAKISLLGVHKGNGTACSRFGSVCSLVLTQWVSLH